MTIEYTQLRSLLTDFSITNLETAIELFKDAVTDFKANKTLTESNSILRALSSFEYENDSQDIARLRLQLAHKIDLVAELNASYIESLEQYEEQLKSAYGDLTQIDTEKTEVIALKHKINLIESLLDTINSARDENLNKLNETSLVIDELNLKIVQMSLENNPSLIELKSKLAAIQLESRDVLIKHSNLLDMHAENSCELAKLEDTLKKSVQHLAQNEVTLIGKKTSILEFLDELVADSEKIQTEFTELNFTARTANETMQSFTPGLAHTSSSALSGTRWLWNMFASGSAEQEKIGLESPASLLSDDDSIPPALIPAVTPTATTALEFADFQEADSTYEQNAANACSMR